MLITFAASNAILINLNKLIYHQKVNKFIIFDALHCNFWTFGNVFLNYPGRIFKVYYTFRWFAILIGFERVGGLEMCRRSNGSQRADPMASFVLTPGQPGSERALLGSFTWEYADVRGRDEDAYRGPPGARHARLDIQVRSLTNN